MRKGDWKLIRVRSTVDGSLVSRERYNLATDPAESTDLSASRSDLVTLLEREMDAAHLPTEQAEFFRGPDSFFSRSGVTVSHDSLGFALSGDGYVMQPLSQDLEGRFRFRLRMSPGGLFAVSSDKDFDNGFRVESTGEQLLLQAGGQSAAVWLLAVAETPTDFILIWHDATLQRKLVIGEVHQVLTLTENPDPSRYVGYGLEGGRVSFAPADLVCRILNCWRGISLFSFNPTVYDSSMNGSVRKGGRRMF